MSKMCANCGQELNDTDDFCFKCGAAITEDHADTEQACEEENLETVAEVIEETNEEIDITDKPKNRKKVNKLIIALVVMLVLVIGVSGFFGGRYFIHRNEVLNKIEDYIDVVYLGKTENFDKLLPIDLINKYIDDPEYVFTADDFSADVTALAEERGTAMDEYFGNNISITYEITSFSELYGNTKNLYLDLNDLSAFESYGKIGAAYRFTYDITVKGSKISEKYSYISMAVEFDGEWYLYSIESEQFMFYDTAYPNTYMDYDLGIDSDV